MELMQNLARLHMEYKTLHGDIVSKLSMLWCQACLAAELCGLPLLISLSLRILSFNGENRKKRCLGEVSPDQMMVTAQEQRASLPLIFTAADG